MADQQPIDDALIGKFLAGETDPAESARVRQWLESRPGSSSFDTGVNWRTAPRKIRSVDRRPISRSEHMGGSLPVLQSESPLVVYPTVFRLVTILVLVTGMGWLTYQLQFMGHDHPAAYQVTLTTNDHQLNKTLPDGTRILLNRHSSLRYPAAFADDQRAITLTGEAFFDVTPDSTRPFRIKVRHHSVEALGTSFSVRAYDANVNVAVQTGRLRFSSGREVVVLTRNQQAKFDASANVIRLTPLLSPNVFAYRTNQLIFDKELLQNVVQTINQVYNIDVRLANDKLGNCRLTSQFYKVSGETAISTIANTLGLNVRHEGKQVTLDGTDCQ